MSDPGTYNRNGEVVKRSDALPLWAEAARMYLLKVAQTYNALCTYQELANFVQEEAGIWTRALLQNWIGDVLELVGQSCIAKGEPLITALCVRADGTVGPGYAMPVEAKYGEEPDDLQMHAAIERLSCHRFFGADLPTDGGSPKLPPQVIRAREWHAKQRRQTMKRKACPQCHWTLPLSGICDNCDDE